MMKPHFEGKSADYIRGWTDGYLDAMKINASAFEESDRIGRE